MAKLTPFRLNAGTEEQGMIKTVLRFEKGMSNNDKLAKLKQVDDWLTEQFGPAVPRDNNKQRRRKKWSAKINYWSSGTDGNIEIYTRDPQNATLVSLRWS